MERNPRKIFYYLVKKAPKDSVLMKDCLFPGRGFKLPSDLSRI